MNLYFHFTECFELDYRGDPLEGNIFHLVVKVHIRNTFWKNAQPLFRNFNVVSSRLGRSNTDRVAVLQNICLVCKCEHEYLCDINFSTHSVFIFAQFQQNSMQAQRTAPHLLTRHFSVINTQYCVEQIPKICIPVFSSEISSIPFIFNGNFKSQENQKCLIVYTVCTNNGTMAFLLAAA